MSNELEENKVLLDKKTNRCCHEHESIFVITYSSGRTWICCNFCEQDEAFRLGRTSRTRITS
jgi:hypothetical protein